MYLRLHLCLCSALKCPITNCYAVNLLLFFYIFFFVIEGDEDRYNLARSHSTITPYYITLVVGNLFHNSHKKKKAKIYFPPGFHIKILTIYDILVTTIYNFKINISEL